MIRVSCLLYEGFVLLDMAGPLTSFETAAQCGVAGYSVETIAEYSGEIRSSCGITVGASDINLSGGCDVLIVPGCSNVQDMQFSARIIEFIKNTADSGARVASVCSGAFLLAEAGLLTGKSAATHWREAAELARRYPLVNVDAERLFVQDGNIWTSAGISSGIDLALAIIQNDYGFSTAKSVAQILVVAASRPGGQSQHSALLEMVRVDDRFSDILIWARSNLTRSLDVESLAERAALSVRQFTRAFTASVGMAPAKAIERLRLESARSAIECGARSLDQVARNSGFGSTDKMRRAFIRRFGLAPRAFQPHRPPDNT